MEKVLGREDEEQLAADLEEQLVADLSQLSAWQESSEGSMCSHDDPYADSSIGSGAQPVLPMDQKERLMKRKVLRHRPDGRVEVSDESLNIKPCKNPWCTGHSRRFRDDTIYDEETESSSNLEGLLPYDDDDWILEDSACSLLGDFGSDTISEYSIPKRPPTTYIVPQADKLKRTDPVARLNAYRRDWQRFSFPGQDSHQSLRWAVRRQMLQSGGSRRAQQRAVPKKHEVPAPKKQQRDTLRPGKRWDLPRPVMPRRDVAF